MDREFRALERQVAVEPAQFPLLLRAAARSGKLDFYRSSIPSYFQLFSEEELIAKITLSNPSYFRDYQKKIIAFHLTHPGSGNFSEMGTAKFETAIGALRVLFEDDIALVMNKCLVLCVPACKPLIEANIERLLPEHRDKIRVVTYIRSWRIEEELLSEKYPIVICDEAHRIINPHSRQSQMAYKLGDQALYRIALTGCPVLNRIEDIFGLLRFIEPTSLGKSWNAFLKKYFDTIFTTVNNHHIFPQRTPKPGTINEVSDLMYQNAIRFVHSEILLDNNAA